MTINSVVNLTSNSNLEEAGLPLFEVRSMVVMHRRLLGKVGFFRCECSSGH